MKKLETIYIIYTLNPLTGIGALKRPTGSDLLISITLF